MHVAYFDTNETLETKLLAGSSGYDIVVPTASYFERQIKAGVYLTLDKSKLPNLKNMDPQLMAKVAQHDPDNAHGIIYMWGTNGIGYNEKMVKALMPDAPLDSWRLVFDPAVASKVAKCGISVLDSPAEMMRAVYSYLGKDPNSQKPEDLAAGGSHAARRSGPTSATSIPRNTSRRWPTAICASRWATTAMCCRRATARARPTRASRSSTSCPRRARSCGSTCWRFRRMRPIPTAPTPIMNYIMTPQVIADISNFKRYANANAAAQPLVLAAVKDDPGIYPPPELRQKLAVQLADSADQTRAITRVWQKFKTGQ